jgi:hypothetical protein
MNRALRAHLTVLLVVGALAGATGARAAVSNSSGDNVQDGNNRATGNQKGADKSGDAVGGQVIGVVSSGRTSIDAKNTSTNADVTSGEARSANNATTFTGLTSDEGTTLTASSADLTNIPFAKNLQEGSNRTTYSQAANATTGDGVAGQVIGAVTAAGGSTSIVAANTSDNVSVRTGEARTINDFAVLTGLNETSNSPTAITADILNSCNGVTGNAPTPCDNVQQGNNRATVGQTSTAHSGDGVAGQVIGAVSAGATSIDASNTSTNVDVQTGDAKTDNGSAMLVGLNDAGTTTIGPADIIGVRSAENLQQGANTATINQTASATTGDGVAGEVIGAVTSAGGSASIVAANTSNNSDVTTGDATSNNAQTAMVGFDADSNRPVTIVDIINSCTVTGLTGCDYVQEGNNRLTVAQTSTSTTGDGVAGQVLGVVSAGRASLDATNRTDDSSVLTGDSKATNDSSAFVGLNDGGTTTVGAVAADITGANAENIQQGDNRKTLTQSADASSGDAVAGQVSGVVTSAGGDASVVVANSSTAIDATSGNSNFDNTDAAFVGLNISNGPLTIG